MVSIPISLPAEYWQTLQISKKDIEFLHNHLFESETPMTARELVGVLIEERVRAEQAAQAKKRQSDGKIYLPKDQYTRWRPSGFSRVRLGKRCRFCSATWGKSPVWRF